MDEDLCFGDYYVIICNDCGEKYREMDAKHVIGTVCDECGSDNLEDLA